MTFSFQTQKRESKAINLLPPHSAPTLTNGDAVAPLGPFIRRLQFSMYINGVQSEQVGIEMWGFLHIAAAVTAVKYISVLRVNVT